MEIVTISLDALLQRATNGQNVDKTAVEAFCALVTNQKDGAHIGSKLIASRMHSKNEKEALNTLSALGICMKRCNAGFHSEIGKFRFLNEMIKLVSPKYLGSQTPASVKQMVLHLLYVWTIDLPKETKIKEAYDMLKKQGVIKEVPYLSSTADVGGEPQRRLGSNSLLQDEEKNRMLQKLLQSKNPEDLQAANRLIKNMVKEDEKKAEMKSRTVTELESVHNSVRLLNEMLDTYRLSVSSKDELDLIKELRDSCERLRPNVFKLINDAQGNDDVLDEVLQASDELSAIFGKYTEVIEKGNTCGASNLSLLDLAASPVSETDDKLRDRNKDMDLLSDIFDNVASDSSENVLKPVALPNTSTLANGTCKSNALDSLDALKDHLMRENLTPASEFNKHSEKIPMNLLAKQSENKQSEQTKDNDSMQNLDLTCLMIDSNGCDDKTEPNGDDLLVDITELASKRELLKLSDISIALEDITPSPVPPLTVLEERNGVIIKLHFGENRPRDDVSVAVVTTVSKNRSPLTNFLFQAVVPKGCKLRLLGPSGTQLPAHNPFLPPSAITQVMLIANPERRKLSLKVMVSYAVEDETFTELGEVESLPEF